jgi:3-hydroxyisobutyrate dehydrogenase-like beta-hydroxyacid dehydrogenase
MQYVCDRDENAHKFSIANLSKDIRYVNAMATDAGVMNVMASAARHYFTHAEAIGKGGDFVPMLSDHIGNLNGMDLAAEVAKGKK